MTRYFFDLYNGDGLTRDEEGQEAPDEGAVRALAIDNIRSILSGEVRCGTLDLGGRIEVRRDAEETIMRIGFGEALTVRPADDARR